MIMAYYRLKAFEDIQRSYGQMMKFTRRFQLDNPLTEFGNNVWFKADSINLTYDAFGPFAAIVRGLFEFIYQADSLTLIPHVPPSIIHLEQHFPIRFGSKRLYISHTGTGPITKVLVNDTPLPDIEPDKISLNYGTLPEVACIRIARGNATPGPCSFRDKPEATFSLPAKDDPFWSHTWPHSKDEPTTSKTISLTELQPRLLRIEKLYQELVSQGKADSYAAAHARLILEYIETIKQRRQLSEKGRLVPLPPKAQSAADRSYVDALIRLVQGLERHQNGKP